MRRNRRCEMKHGPDVIRGIEKRRRIDKTRAKGKKKEKKKKKKKKKMKIFVARACLLPTYRCCQVHRPLQREVHR